MSNIDREWFNMHLAELAEDGRDVQLYNVNGQTMFPLWSAAGGLLTDAAVFPILRGSGDRCPAFDGKFPMEDGETLALGNGWIAMCVRLGYHLTAHEKIGKIQEAETKLRQLRGGKQCHIARQRRYTLHANLKRNSTGPSSMRRIRPRKRR